MSVFDAYTGVWLNGLWHQKSDLQPSYIAWQAPVVRQALEFAAQLFDLSPTIEVQTSGSTGRPKTWVFPKASLIQSAEATNRYFRLLPTTRALLPLSLAFIAGKMMVARAIVGGYQLEVEAPSAQPIADGEQYDFAPLSPYQFQRIWEVAPEKLRRVSQILIGGGSPNLRSVQMSQLGATRVFASFGMAETLSHFAIAPLSESQTTPYYQALEGVALRTGENGRLEVSWPGIINGWLETNDVVELHGDCFTWIGRADFLINSGGVKIHPEPIEQRLAAFIQTPFFLFGVPDPYLGQQVVLFVEGDLPPILPDSAWIHPYEKPKKVALIQAFARTPTGKVMRKVTAEAWEVNN